MTELDKLKERLLPIFNQLSQAGRRDALSAIGEAYQLGRESVQNELAAELTGGSSILRDPSAMLRDPSAVVDVARNSELRDAAIAAQEGGDMKTAAALNMISQTPIGDKPDDDACLYGGWWA